MNHDRIYLMDFYTVKYLFDFETSHNQFYIVDGTDRKSMPSYNFWKPDALTARLAVEKGIVGVLTLSYGHIKGEIRILLKEFDLIDFNQYDHIVEGGLDVKSGILEVLDCPTSKVACQIELEPGLYRIRIYSSGFKDTDLDEMEGNDYYRIEIWPGNTLERKLLKQIP